MNYWTSSAEGTEMLEYEASLPFAQKSGKWTCNSIHVKMNTNILLPVKFGTSLHRTSSLSQFECKYKTYLLNNHLKTDYISSVNNLNWQSSVLSLNYVYMSCWNLNSCLWGPFHIYPINVHTFKWFVILHNIMWKMK